MTLSDFDFCNRASGDVKSFELKASGKEFLSHSGLFSEPADVVSYCFFNVFIHVNLPLHRFKNKSCSNYIVKGKDLCTHTSAGCVNNKDSVKILIYR